MLRDFQPSLSSVSRQLDSAGQAIAEASGTVWTGASASPGINDSPFGGSGTWQGGDDGKGGGDFINGWSGGGGGGGGAGADGGPFGIGHDYPGHSSITVLNGHGYSTVDLNQSQANFGGSIHAADGTLTANANFGASYNAIHLQGGGETGNIPFGPIEASGGVNYDATVGANVNGDATMTISRDKVEGEVKVDAFVGLQANASAHVDVGGLGASVTGTVSVGVGATLDIQGGYDHGHIKATVDIGATLGIGGSIKFNVDLNVDEAAKSVTNIAKDIFHWFGH